VKDAVKKEKEGRVRDEKKKMIGEREENGKENFRRNRLGINFLPLFPLFSCLSLPLVSFRFSYAPFSLSSFREKKQLNKNEREI
jgi:hypothetical protein